MRDEKAAVLEEGENALRLNDELLNNREQSDEAFRLREALTTIESERDLAIGGAEEAEK